MNYPAPQYPSYPQPPAQQFPGYPQQPPAPAFPQAPQYPQQAYPAQGPQFPQAPQQQPSQPLANGTLDDFYNQPSTGGGPSISWKDKPVGTSYAGIVARDVTSADVQQQVNFQSKQPEFYRDGRPKFVMKVPLKVQPSQEFPDGEAAFYVRGQARDELVRAMSEAGASGAPKAGAVIQVTLVQRKPSGQGMNPANVVQIRYTPPQDGQQAPQQAPEAQPQVQQQYVPQAQAPAAPAPQQQQFPQQGQVVNLEQAVQHAQQPQAPAPQPVQQPQQAAPQAPAAPQPPSDLSPEQRQLLAQLTGGNTGQ